MQNYSTKLLAKKIQEHIKRSFIADVEIHSQARNQAPRIQLKRRRDYMSKWVGLDHDGKAHRDSWPEFIEVHGL